MSQKRFVYLLESVIQPGRPYIGLTSDITARLAAQNAGRSPHTARYRPWRLVVAIEYGEETDAVRFERYVKSGSGRSFARRHFGC